MLVSCRYCNAVHERGFKCGKKLQPKRVKASNEVNRFRWSWTWAKKSKQIRTRDKNLCQLCLIDGKYTFDNLEVHHINPLQESWHDRLEESNLISLCVYHHRQADNGEISKKKLAEIVERIIRDESI